MIDVGGRHLNKSGTQLDKKAQILRAATILIKERGLQSLSFEAVAHQAGFSRQLIRYYFTDLDMLIVALCDYLGSGYRDLLVVGIIDVSQVKRIDFFLDFFFDLADEHPMPDNLAAYDSLLAYAVGSDVLRDQLCDQYLTLGQVIIHELAIAYPELDGRACEELSFLFVSMMHAHWSFVASLGYARDHGRLTRRAIDRLIASYVADPSPTPGVERAWARDK